MTSSIAMRPGGPFAKMPSDITNKILNINPDLRLRSLQKHIPFDFQKVHQLILEYL
jgi:hypothetical protein